MVTKQIRDNNMTNRTVIQGVVNDAVIYTVSLTNLQLIVLTPTNAITGFDVIRQGLTLRNTTSGTNGVTADQTRFHGTATNADRLGGNLASDYALAGAANFTSIVRFGDPGFTVGAANDPGCIYRKRIRRCYRKYRRN